MSARFVIARTDGGYVVRVKAANGVTVLSSSSQADGAVWTTVDDLGRITSRVRRAEVRDIDERTGGAS